MISARNRVAISRRAALKARASSIAVFAGLSAFAPLAAHAQSAPKIEEIVVTATKRETKVQETPMSITALSADMLSVSGADDFSGFSKLVPGLTAIDSGPGNKRYALRGLQSGGEPEVGLYYDEIPIAGVPGESLDTGDSQPDVKLWDVERVEVLRGPQGTLYGNGSMGGTIRIISKRPVFNKREGAAQVTGAMTDGGDPSFRLNGMVNLPLVDDKLAFRLSAYYRHEGGWIDAVPRANIKLPQLKGNDINTERTYGGRASLKFQANDRWTITGIAYYQHTKAGSTFETYPSFALPGNRYVTEAFVQKPWPDQATMFNLISDYDLKFADLLVTGSYQRRTVDRSLDTTRFVLSLFGCTEFTWQASCFGPPLVPTVSFGHERESSWSGEARLVSSNPGRFQWTAGTFLQNTDTYRRGQVAVVDATGNITFNPTTGNANNRIFARTNNDAFDQYAFFGEGSYEILDGLKATVGLRYFHSSRSDLQSIIQQFFPGAPTGPEPLQKFSESDLFKKFALSYQVDKNSLFYVQASQGFRAGGPNFPGGFTTFAPPYSADSVWDYEGGWKTSFADNRFIFNGAIFHIEWSNLQQVVANSVFSFIANAGAATASGFETEFSAKLLDSLELNTGLTYTDAHLTGKQPTQIDPTTQGHDGDRLPNVPKWTANANLTYSRAFDATYTGSARLGFTYQSARGNLVATQNKAYFVAKSYELVDLRLGVDHGDQWGVSLNVDNLLNRYAELSAKALDSNLIKTYTAARPRTVSLTFNTKF